MILLSKDFELPADGFFQVSPLGEFPGLVEHEDGTLEPVVQVVDAESVRLQIANFAAAATAPNFGGVLIDYDHFSDDRTKPSRAAGWIMEMANREGDGIYGKFRFTPSGEAAVKGGEYRFCSPVWDFVRLDGNRVRPTALAKLALTNDPNIKTLKPLSNRSQKEGGAGSMSGTTQGAGTPVNTQAAQAGAAGDLSAILAALGLPPEAKGADVVQAIQAIQKQLADLQAKQADAQAESDLAEFGDSIANRAEVKKQLIANREGTLTILRSMNTQQPAKKPLVNRAGNKLPTGEGEAQAEAKEKQRCARIRNRASEIMKVQGVNYSTAWDMAAAEMPKEV